MFENIKTNGVAFDTETHLVQPGLLAPPLVCGSIATFASASLLNKEQARRDFVRLLQNSEIIIIGANIAYDMLVMAVECAKHGQNIIPAIFRAYEEERVFDVEIAERLHAIAIGSLGKDPRTGLPLRDPRTGQPTRYSLSMVTDLVLRRSDAKQNDRWRLSYALLENIPIDQWPEDARQYPVDDVVNTRAVAVAQVERNKNLHDLPKQCYAAWAMHLGAAWGFSVDTDALYALEKRVTDSREGLLEPFREANILREDGSKDTSVIKKLVAKAYGCDESNLCPTCLGTGKVVSGKTGKPIQCKACGATSYNLDIAAVPRTQTGGVQTSRDALFESGDDLLMDFAEFGEEDKVLTTYVPWLKKGIGRPLNLKPNVLVETGRASYGLEHQTPRGMGIRECVVARPGYVLCSCDYSGLELATHAQSCLWILGTSKLAEALNAGIKVHDALGARIASVPYDHFSLKNPFHKACRQTAKPANFGFLGGMGAPRLVLQQRKQGPDTPSENASTYIYDDERNRIHGYRGLRFCVLMDNSVQCGAQKITEWKQRPMPPACARCVAIAEDIRNKWFDQWPENRGYFDYVARQVDNHGYVIQHRSGRVRGGVSFTSAANGYFQGLAADGAKLALTRVAHEEYVKKSSPLYGSRTIYLYHDELLVEIPEANVHEAATRLSEIMVESMREYTPDVKIEAPPALMRRWYKGAEPVYQNGKLVPWEPEAKV